MLNSKRLFMFSFCLSILLFAFVTKVSDGINNKAKKIDFTKVFLLGLI